MRNFYKDFFKDKVLISNLGYLTALNVFTLLLPLITFSYLIRVLGKDIYGLIVYAQAIIAYFNIFINFGFNISATKNISVSRNVPLKVSEIVSSVLIIKIILFLFSTLLLILFIILIPQLKSNQILYILTFGVCINETIFPVWYFQGKEKMKFITLINLISKGTFTVLMFFFINTKHDYLLVPVLNLVGAIIAGFISIHIVFYIDKVRFVIPKLSILWGYTKESFPFFFSRATGIFILRTNTVLIGSLLSFADVAYYDLAFKITEICKIPSTLLNQAIYPRIAITKNMKMVVKIINLNIIISIMIYFGVMILINPIIMLLGGVEMLPAKNIIFLLNITMPLAGITYFLGNTMLVVNGYHKPFNMSVVFKAIIYLVFAALLISTSTYSIYNLVGIIIISSIFEPAYRYYYVKKFKLI